MRRFPMVAAAILWSCASALAQTPMSSSALGPTSPLGIPGVNGAAPSSAFPGAGIGLGATEINPGGLSPAASQSCGGASGVSPAGTFDGGGISPAAAGGTACAATSSGAASAASTASPSSGGLPASGTGIPLGATELGGAGVSPAITVPAPVTIATPSGSTAACGGLSTGC